MRKDGPLIGMTLGVANAAVIALGISALESSYRMQAATVVFLFGSLPAILTGAALGRLADKLANSPRWVRVTWILTPAWGVVALLGYATGFREVVTVSCIPTAAAALWLERRTRPVSDDDASARVIR